MVKNTHLLNRCTLELPTTYVTEIKETNLKYTLNKYHVQWLSSFKHLKLPISYKISVTIWQIVYI